jgi:hypothetical protein
MDGDGGTDAASDVTGTREAGADRVGAKGDPSTSLRVVPSEVEGRRPSRRPVATRWLALELPLSDSVQDHRTIWPKS